MALIAVIAATLIAFAMSFAVNRVGRRLRLLHFPGPGRVHNRPVVRGGGVAILPAVFVAVLATSTDPGEYVGIAACAAAITAIGLADDLWGMPPLAKLSGQTGVAVAAVLVGVHIEVVSNPFGGAIELHPALGGAMAVFWLVGMMNAINLLDGLDGLAPGVVLVAALILALLSANLGNGALAAFGLVLAGSIAGFLPFNAYQAKLILGDSGSNLLGFLIGTLAVLGQAKIGTALLVLGIPILDVAWAIIRRQLSGRGIMTRDTEHLHHRLLAAGLSQPKVTLLYVTLCALFGGSALLLERSEKLIALSGLAAVTAGLLYLGAKKSKERKG